jgi:hypothetical protein
LLPPSCAAFEEGVGEEEYRTPIGKGKPRETYYIRNNGYHRHIKKTAL